MSNDMYSHAFEEVSPDGYYYHIDDDNNEVVIMKERIVEHIHIWVKNYSSAPVVYVRGALGETAP